MTESKQEHENHEHHVLSYSNCLKVFGALLVLTALTVGVAQIDLGHFNLPVAIIIATIKGLLVCMFFMGLKYDRPENSVIFGTSFLFLIIFIALTSFDLFYRGDVYVKADEPDKFQLAAQAATGSGKYEKPWNSRPEMVAEGKALYGAQCVVCHGANGMGDGPAAAGLNPKPRDFTHGKDWKNGRKPSQIYTTLTKGLGGMPSFGSLSKDDIWSLVHYVASLGPDQLTSTDAELAAAGVDPSGAAAAGDASLPIDLTIKIMQQD